MSAAMDPLVCVANIGPRQRRIRLAFGLAMAGIAVALLVAVPALGLPRTARLLVFFPAWLAALGILQHREKT